jgi:hypothetical protein
MFIIIMLCHIMLRPVMLSLIIILDSRYAAVIMLNGILLVNISNVIVFSIVLNVVMIDIMLCQYAECHSASH